MTKDSARVRCAHAHAGCGMFDPGWLVSEAAALAFCGILPARFLGGKGGTRVLQTSQLVLCMHISPFTP